MARRGSPLSWLSRTSVRIATDATWVFIIIIALSLSSSAFSIRYLSTLDSDFSDLFENDIKGQTIAQNAFVALLEIESNVKDLVIANSEQARSEAEASVSKKCASLQSLIAKVTLTLNAGKYPTLIAKSKRDVNALVDTIHSSVGVDPSTLNQDRSLLADVQTAIAPLRDDIITINDIKRNANRNWLHAIRIQLRISLGTTIVILLISLTVRVFLYRLSRLSLRKTVGGTRSREHRRRDRDGVE
jgi:hypothetical protein